MEKRWLSTTVAGRMLGVSSQSVRRLIEAGKLEVKRTTGGQYRVLVSSIEGLDEALRGDRRQHRRGAT